MQAVALTKLNHHHAVLYNFLTNLFYLNAFQRSIVLHSLTPYIRVQHNLCMLSENGMSWQVDDAMNKIFSRT